MVGPDTSSGSKKEAALLSWIQKFAFYGVITLDTSFRVQTWNHWMEIHSALRFEDVAGKDLFNLFPDLRERKLVSYFELALAGESSVLSTSLHHYLLRLPSPLREPGVLHMLQTARIAPLLSEGQICGILVVIEDVTQRESQADALRRQHERDIILSWASAHLLESEQPRKTIRQLFFKIAEHLDFDTFFLYLRDLETGILGLYTTGGVAVELEKDFVDYPLFTAEAEAAEMRVFDSVQSRTEPAYQTLQKVGVSAAVTIPLRVNDRPLGLLCFATWSRDAIAADETELLTTIAQYLATAVDRENANHQLRKATHQLTHHAQLLEEKVAERTSQLQETISELETFSYTVAHDLKAPTRGMTGYCQVLLEDFADVLPAGAKRIVQRLGRISQRMEALTRDLLKFSRVSRQDIILSAVDIAPIIEDLLILRAPTVRQAITVVSPLHPVRANRTLLQHVISNLVDNAIKFVEPGKSPKIAIYTEVVIHFAPNTRSRSLLFSSTETSPIESVSVPRELPPKQIRIWVVDEGIGIPTGAHQKVFGIFERAVTPEAYDGTGMGLAIVARAVQRMNGTCGVESEPMRGSRFWVQLPAA